MDFERTPQPLQLNMKKMPVAFAVKGQRSGKHNNNFLIFAKLYSFEIVNAETYYTDIILPLTNCTREYFPFVPMQSLSI